MNEYQADAAHDRAEEDWVTDQYDMFQKFLEENDYEEAASIVERLALTGHASMANDLSTELNIQMESNKLEQEEDSDTDSFIEQEALNK